MSHLHDYHERSKHHLDPYARGVGLAESLRNFGVSPEQLSKIDVRVRPPAGSGWLGSTFWLLPVLFLGLMMVLFMRQGGSQPDPG